jgi:hypothetical protein
MEDLVDLTDQLADRDIEHIDQAIPNLARLASLALVRPVLRQAGGRLSPALHQRLTYSADQAARSLVRRQGSTGIRILPRIIRSIRRNAVRHRLPARALPRSIRNITAWLASRPRLARRLSRPSLNFMDLWEDRGLDAAFSLDTPYATRQEMIQAVRELEAGMKRHLPGPPLPRTHILTDIQRRGLMENVRTILNKMNQRIQSGTNPNVVRRTLRVQLRNPRFRFIGQIPEAHSALRGTLGRQ